jgi:Leucine-rich repeat (LRR) protein
MNLLIFLKISCCFLVLSTVGVRGDLPTFKCKSKIHSINMVRTKICEFPKPMKLTANEKHFIPKSDVPAEEVLFISALTEGRTEIHTLTSDICNAFPNLQVISIRETGLKEIDVDAFNNCKDLNQLSLVDNNISQIDPELFKENSKLSDIFLSGNNIRQIDPELFKKNSKLNGIYLSFNEIEEIDLDMLKYTPNLKHFELSGNQLKELNFTRMPVMEHLTHLYIHENKLTEIDQNEVIIKMPNLKTFMYNDNNIPKEEFDQLDTFFESNGIRVYNKNI